MIIDAPATFSVDQLNRGAPAARPPGLFAAWWLGWQSFVTATGVLSGEQTAEITRARLRGGLMK
jgi:hypothetical protein